MYALFLSQRAEAHEEMAQSQLQFIEDTLSKSTADFLIVAGHYPVYRYSTLPLSFFLLNAHGRAHTHTLSHTLPLLSLAHALVL